MKWLHELAMVRRSSLGSDAALELIDRLTSELAAADRALTTEAALGRQHLALLAYRRTRAGAPARVAVQLAERALAGGHLLSDGFGSAPLFAAGIVLGLAGRTTAAEQLFDEIAQRAETCGSLALLSAACGQRGVERFRRGALPPARDDLERAVTTARGELWENVVDDRRAHLVRVHVERGAYDAAERYLDRWGATGPLPETPHGNQLLVERGRLRLAQGRAYDALADFRSAELRLTAPFDSLLLEWRGPAALAHLRAGDRATAARLANEDLEIATAWGAPRQHGMATLTQGLVEPTKHRIQLLRDAVEILETSTARLEHARSSIELGAALRRSGRPTDARRPLLAGLELALQCGSPRLADTAHQELAATGTRRHRRTLLSGPDALTPTEHRVARLAATGLSNPEIARTLFITRKTVEMHLGNTYRKLGIHSREQLKSAPEFAA